MRPFAKCVGARNTASDKVAEAHSEDFDLGDAQLSSSATSYRSESDLDADIAKMHSPKASACFDQLVKTQLAPSLPSGSKIESASTKITPGSAGGPAKVIANGTSIITISVNGQRGTIYATTAFIRGRLIEADVTSSSVGAPVPASVVNPLVAAVAARAAKG
jgi:hypothetical protein